jgi:hypothetical protein
VFACLKRHLAGNQPGQPSIMVKRVIMVAPLRPRYVTDFIGKGRMSAVHDVDRQYMGCVTNAGLQTADETQCGIFTGELTNDSGLLISINLLS